MAGPSSSGLGSGRDGRQNLGEPGPAAAGPHPTPRARYTGVRFEITASSGLSVPAAKADGSTLLLDCPIPQVKGPYLFFPCPQTQHHALKLWAPNRHMHDRVSVVSYSLESVHASCHTGCTVTISSFESRSTTFSPLNLVC